jgi:hypothetical protein
MNHVQSDKIVILHPVLPDLVVERVGRTSFIQVSGIHYPNLRKSIADTPVLGNRRVISSHRHVQLTTYFLPITAMQKHQGYDIIWIRMSAFSS